VQISQLHFSPEGVAQQQISMCAPDITTLRWWFGQSQLKVLPTKGTEQNKSEQKVK
jgi:hypothetical protein